MAFFSQSFGDFIKNFPGAAELWENECMEKLQLIQSLKHWCDLIWEYNQAIGKIYVYRDKLAIKLENNWYDPAELDRIIRQEYRFEISRSDSFFSADSVPEMVQKNTRLQ